MVFVDCCSLLSFAVRRWALLFVVCCFMDVAGCCRLLVFCCCRVLMLFVCSLLFVCWCVLLVVDRCCSLSYAVCCCRAVCAVRRCCLLAIVYVGCSLFLFRVLLDDGCLLLLSGAAGVRCC